MTFNDPFDMYEGLLDFTATNQQKKAWANNTYEGKSRTVRRRLQKLTKKVGPNYPVAVKHGFTEMKKDSGVCCFSKFNNVQLMWSHYANKHEGICFGFDFEPINTRNDFTLILGEVSYPDKIKPISFASYRDAAIDYWLYTKSKAWSYEHEIRALIYDRKGYNFFEFERACLKEIYFGCRVSTKQIEDTLSFLTQHNYKPVIKRKMIIDDSLFDIKSVDL